MQRILVLAAALCASVLFFPTGAEAGDGDAQVAVVTIEGMTCGGCAMKVRDTLAEVDGVQAVNASFSEGSACVILKKPVEQSAIVSALTELGYTVTEVRYETECPAALSEEKPKDPWAAAGGLDVERISNGEEVDLKAKLVPGKFTIVDFGAHWCGPCHEAAEDLLPYLTANPDTAVRVVNLDGADAEASYKHPVVAQHLAAAPGIPWLQVYDPKGKRIYQGQDPAKAMSAIDKRRDKLSRN